MCCDYLVDGHKHGVQVVGSVDAASAIASHVKLFNVFDQIFRPLDQNSVETKKEELGEHVILCQKKYTRGQFHQRFTSNFFAHSSQKRKKDHQIKQLFALLGYARVKAACRTLVKLTLER